MASAFLLSRGLRSSRVLVTSHASFRTTTTRSIGGVFLPGLAHPFKQLQQQKPTLPPFQQLALFSTNPGIRFGKKRDPANSSSVVPRDPQQQQQQDDEAEHQQTLKDSALSERTRTILSRLGVVGTGMIYLAGKTKYVLVALKMTKMTSIFSLLASTAAYGMVYGLPFGVGVTSMLLVHEAGHAAMMLRFGIPITPMLFIPFMGAVVGMTRHPRSAFEHGLVAIAGPLAGSAFAASVAVAGVSMDSQLLMAVGDFGLWINLFNLLPIGGLDGGVIAGTLNRWFLVGGLGAGGALIYTGMVSNPMFYLIMFAAGFSTFQRFFGDVHPVPGFYEIPRSRKIFLGSSYLALIMALLAAMRLNNQYRKSPAQIKREMQTTHPNRDEQGGMGDQILTWSQEYQDPEYFKGGADQQHQLASNDPYFQKGRWQQ